MRLKGITLLAYDTAVMVESIRSYIDHLDELLVGLDENRQTWAGSTYELEPGIVEKLQAISPKVRIVEDMFYMPGLGTMDNDTRERNFLSSHIENFDYILSVDSDEILLNADATVDWLKQVKQQDVCILGSWVNVYKELEDGYLVIGNDSGIELSDVPIITDRTDRFVNARWTRQNYIMSPAVLLHFSWARTETELRRKLANWSHSEDFCINDHLNMWLKADAKNYGSYRNFHPVTPTEWPALKLIPKDQLRETAGRLAAAKTQAVTRGTAALCPTSR
jgi:hypothetical protein